MPWAALRRLRQFIYTSVQERLDRYPSVPFRRIAVEVTFRSVLFNFYWAITHVALWSWTTRRFVGISREPSGASTRSEEEFGSPSTDP